MSSFRTVLLTPSSREKMLLKREPPSPPPHTTYEQPPTLMEADYNSNSFNFSYDGSFSLSPHQMELKEAGLTSSSQPQSPSTAKTSFLAIQDEAAKSDKMISGFEGRTDGLSPLSVIAVSAYQDAGNSSPGSILSSRTTHVLRFHPGGQQDTMLSALNYSDSDLGGFDSSGGNAFGGLDGLLGSGGTALLDQEAASYMEADLADTFRESSPLAGMREDVKTDIKNQLAESAMDKLKVKSVRPAKAVSPSRPGTQPCPTCGKVFSNSSALTKHKLTHSDERKYVCQLCAKAFKRQDHLNGHMLTHRNKKPFECDAEGCGKSYCDARSLRRHKENHHSTSQVAATAVIPGLAHLGFQTSFPASVITSAAGGTTTFSDRIQYAPPPPTVNRTNAAATEKIQFLTFQQGHSMQQASSSSRGGGGQQSPKQEGVGWQPQTINTGALLLAQNFGRTFEEQGNSSGSELSQQKSDPQEPQLEQACFEVVDSSTGAKQLVSLTPQGQLHFEVAVKREVEPPTTPTAKEPPANGASPLLQQLLNQQQQESQQNSSVLMSTWSQVPFAGTTTISTSRFNSQDPKPVECSLCQRKFKNIPALNGHMRLHGGYFKKENDAKKNEKKNSAPLQTASTNVRALIEEKINQKRNFLLPTTVTSNPGPQSFDFRLNQLQQQQQQQSPGFASPLNSPVVQESPVFNHFPNSSSQASSNDLNLRSPTALQSPTLHSANVRSLQSPTLHSSNLQSPTLRSSSLQSPTLHSPMLHSPNLNSTSLHTSSLNSTELHSTLDPRSDLSSSELHDLNQQIDILKKLDLKSEQFRVPHPPTLEKHRRHSDSDHFILPKRPCATFTSSALSELLRSRVVAKRACRTGSDPGEPLNLDAAFSELADSLVDLPKFLPHTSMDDEEQSHKKFAGEDSEKGNSMQHALMESSSLPLLSAEDIPEAQTTFLPDLDPLERFSDLPEISVSELEMMQFASIVTTKGGNDSNDDDVFLSPTTLPPHNPPPPPPSPLKHKKKRRPEPIYIPPYVNTSHFHHQHSSRLRSPRGRPLPFSLSPPPYTPPPMLSPVRSGSGLFWHILSGGNLTPKSAQPVTPIFGRKASVSESISETEEEYEEVPESDSVPHVNVGSNYQAKIPPFNPHYKDTLAVKADKVWDPSTMDCLTEEEVEMYLELSCCALVPGGGRNKEYALHLLHICKGNIKDAILSLMDFKPKLPPHHPLLTFQYSENDQWSSEEIEAYHQGLLKCDKDFFSIAKEIPGKSVKQCVQLYYLWKKVCPDEYKRIRFIRRRKEQESLIYNNLRSQKEEEERTSPRTHNNTAEDPSEKANDSSPGKHSEVTNQTSTYNGSGLSSSYDFNAEPMEEFPCKICGKVFSKVKSRSAHMKSHRQTDQDKRHRCKTRRHCT